mgnify:CR=1 FL=1
MIPVYRMTRQEIQILSAVVVSWERRLYPELIITRKEFEATLESMERKGFLRKRKKGIEADRIMAGIMKIMVSSERQSFGRETELYCHNRMVILCTKDTHSEQTYRLLLFPDKNALCTTEYAKLLGGCENG